jgi:hypothetical protein
MLMVFSPVVPRALAQEGSAVLTQPQGSIKLVRGKQTTNIREDQLLNVGDEVKVVGEGGAVIYQAYAPVKRLKSNDTHKIRALSPPPQGNALSLEDFASFKKNYQQAQRNRDTASPTEMGAVGENRVTLLAPRNSIVLDGKPTFNWTGVTVVTGITRYTINIYDSNEVIVCTTKVTETRLIYPDKCGNLSPGDYKWDVTAEVEGQITDNPAFYDVSSFSIVSPQQAAAIRNALDHARILSESDAAVRSVYAAVLVEQRLYPQAELELLEALKNSPSDQSLWSLLMETYWLMKRWPAREKARTISTNSQPTLQMIQTLDWRATSVKSN